MLRFSRPSARATAAIREMNKLAESFSFCWVLRTPTAAHSIRIKLAILAIPTDLLATQQLPQRFSGDVHKNEMGLCKAVKKKKKRQRKKIQYIKWMQQPCDGCQVLTQRRVSASSCCLRLTAVIMHLIITERETVLKSLRQDTLWSHQCSFDKWSCNDYVYWSHLLIQRQTVIMIAEYKESPNATWLCNVSASSATDFFLHNFSKSVTNGRNSPEARFKGYWRVSSRR